MTIQEFINKYSDLPKTDTLVYMEDADGKVFKSIEDAHKQGKHPFVTKNLKDAAVEDLKSIGIDSKSVGSKLSELVQYIFGIDTKDKPLSRGRRTYSDQEKAAILEQWKKADKEGKSKAEFSKSAGVTYQTLFKWIKDS
ncbi:MAG: hypothetical protein WD398_01880 [Cyclobacteriaceae bacterium]